MSNAIPAVTPATLAIQGQTARFPLRRVYCVGRNYAEHAREMGHDPDREPPFFFSKPADAVVPAAGTVPYPPQTSDLHHEIELIVAIGEGGANIPVEKALGHVWGYAVGVDFTRRDLQAVAKKAGRPWDLAKGFDASGPSTPLVQVSAVGHPAKGRIWLSVNGEVKQQGDLADLIWPVADVIAYLSQSVRLEPGDLIFTGTPSGVGPAQIGDVVAGGVDGVAEFSFTLGPRAA
ncbi:MAG TPA: fumarylacetoacetate hydrolase family protein [Burkholderiaceae bacterium]